MYLLKSCHDLWLDGVTRRWIKTNRPKQWAEWMPHSPWLQEMFDNFAKVCTSSSTPARGTQRQLPCSTAARVVCAALALYARHYLFVNRSVSIKRVTTWNMSTSTMRQRSVYCCITTASRSHTVFELPCNVKTQWINKSKYGRQWNSVEQKLSVLCKSAIRRSL